MTSKPRSTFQLDLKDLSPRPSTPHGKRIGLVAAAGLALLVIVVISAAMSVDRPSIPAASPDVSAIPKPEAAELPRPEVAAIPEPEVDTVAPSAASVGDPVQPASEETPEPSEAVSTALVPVAPAHTPLPPETGPEDPAPLSSSPAQAGHRDPGDAADQTEEFAADRRAPRPDDPDGRMQLASLAPVPTREQASPLDYLVNDGLPGPADKAPVHPLESALREGNWVTETVRKKDTISHIFRRLGMSSQEAYALVRLEDASVLEKIMPGEKIHVTTLPPEGNGDRERLGKLKYDLGRFTTLLVRSQDDGYVADVIRRPPEIRHRTSHAVIDSSLMGAAKNAGIPFSVVRSLANIFGWQVDFARDIRSGDRFTVIYEEQYLDDKHIGNGQVVAAELVTRDRSLQAVRHVDDDNAVTYYAPDGAGIQGSFLRSPIQFATVTSAYSKRRLHPIQKVWKAHKGVDYGAPMNTPVRSTGDGVVEYTGSKTGYGRTVILRHGEKFQTLYAHLNRYHKGLHVGKRVKQGEVIGYVGTTGWATGPHLHYEFRVNGHHKNPLTVELPKSLPIDRRFRKDFTRKAAHWVAKLESASQIPLAQNDS